MGELQEQRYVCKICSKSCVSGKSLGGHMRIHLALIAASKKSEKGKAVIKMEFQSDDDDDDDANDLPTEEKITDSGDGDQSNSYELRENPKKSWRINNSNPKHGVIISSKNSPSCKECGKEFPSLRALSGHMRCHSTKNQKVHQCKECGKGFDSMRAMFGHMKSHSKKSRIRDNSADSLPDLENLCPVRRKRSRIGYKNTPSASISSLNASISTTVSEFEEVEEIAKCLMMLSRGVKDWVKTEAVTEGSDDSSVYFGSRKFSGDDGYSECDVDKKMKMSFDVLSEFDEIKDNIGVSDEIGRDVDLQVSEELMNEFTVSADKIEKVASEKEANDLDTLKNFMKKRRATVCEAESKLDHIENGESKSKEHECPTCFKVFHSGQALGGHKRAHYTESKSQGEIAEVGDLFDLNFAINVDDGEMRRSCLLIGKLQEMDTAITI